MKIAILGGTGDEGFGLGYRWAAAGHEIIIGSRLAEKGERAAADMKVRLPNAAVSGTDNATAAQQAEVAVLSVPYEAQAATLAAVKEALAGKLLITVVAPLGERKARFTLLPSGKSAAEEAQAQLGEATRVVSAFQIISAHHLIDLDYSLDCDVLVCGNKAADKQIALQLCEDAGLRGVNAGALQNSLITEGLASVMIAINVIHKVKGAGVRITGL